MLECQLIDGSSKLSQIKKNLMVKICGSVNVFVKNWKVQKKTNNYDYNS